MSDQQNDMGTVSDATLEEERRTANMSADAGPMPTEDEEAAAERAEANYDPEHGRNEAEYTKMAANTQGEGRIEG